MALTPLQDVCISEEVLEIEMYLMNKGAYCIRRPSLQSQISLPRIGNIMMQLYPLTPIFIFGHICDVNSKKQTLFLGERQKKNVGLHSE